MTYRTIAPSGADAAAPSAQADPNQSSVARMSDLLRRYPSITEEERKQLLHFLTRGAQEDIVRATFAAGLEPRLIAFRKDHPEHFPGLRSWLPLGLLILLVVIVGLWRLVT